MTLAAREAGKEAAHAAARARVEALLERLARVNLQVVVVAPPDAEREAARERARAAAWTAGRLDLFDEAVEAVRSGVMRAFARGSYSGTWAANDWSMSVTDARDRIAAAAAFEEAAIAEVVEDLVDEETLEVLRATTAELSLSSGIPSPGSLSSVLVRQRTLNRPLGGVLLTGALLTGIGAAVSLGPWIGMLVFVLGAALAAWLAGGTRSGA